MLSENAKMRINSKMRIQNICAQLRWMCFYLIRRRALTMIETKLQNKSLDVQQKNCGCDCKTGLTNGSVSLHGISNVLVIFKCLRAKVCHQSDYV